MFLIHCKILRSATRNRIFEWPWNENTYEISPTTWKSLSCHSLSCLLVPWQGKDVYKEIDVYNKFDISASEVIVEDFCFLQVLCLPGRACFSVWREKLVHSSLRKKLNLACLHQILLLNTIFLLMKPFFFFCSDTTVSLLGWGLRAMFTWYFPLIGLHICYVNVFQLLGFDITLFIHQICTWGVSLHARKWGQKTWVQWSSTLNRAILYILL